MKQTSSAMAGNPERPKLIEFDAESNGGPLGTVLWHELTTPADNDESMKILTRTAHALGQLNYHYQTAQDRMNNVSRRYPLEDIVGKPPRIKPQPEEQPFIKRAFPKKPRAYDEVDLGRLYAITKAKRLRGARGIGKKMIDLVVVMLNAQIEERT